MELKRVLIRGLECFKIYNKVIGDIDRYLDYSFIVFKISVWIMFILV